MYAYCWKEQRVPKGEALQGRPNNLLRGLFPRYITGAHTSYFLDCPLTVSFDKDAAGEAYDQLCAQMDFHYYFSTPPGT